jgi:hypothetical protein
MWQWCRQLLHQAVRIHMQPGRLREVLPEQPVMLLSHVQILT